MLLNILVWFLFLLTNVLIVIRFGLKCLLNVKVNVMLAAPSLLPPPHLNQSLFRPQPSYSFGVVAHSSFNS